MIADLRARLQDSERPSNHLGDPHESHDRVTGADTPLHGVSSEVAIVEEGESLHDISTRLVVTFVDSGGHLGSPGIIPPPSQETLSIETTNVTSCDSGALRPASSVVSGDIPATSIVATPDLTGAVGVKWGAYPIVDPTGSDTNRLWLLHRLGPCQLRAFPLFLPI